MAVYTISNRKTGAVVAGNCRTPLGALRKARQLAKVEADNEYVVSEFPDGKHKTGRPVMYVSWFSETDWRGGYLDFWNDGTPIIDSVHPRHKGV